MDNLKPTVQLIKKIKSIRFDKYTTAGKGKTKLPPNSSYWEEVGTRMDKGKSIGRVSLGGKVMRLVLDFVSLRF